MNAIRKTVMTATAVLALSACAQTNPADHQAHHPAGTAPAAAAAPTAAGTDRMAMMESHMKAMRELREKLAQAATPAERQALMDEHMKLMREGMAMMGGAGHGGMGPGAMGGMGMGGMGAMGGMQGRPGPSPRGEPRHADMEARMQMMEKRMEMMHSLMQGMVDRMGPPPARP